MHDENIVFAVKAYLEQQNCNVTILRTITDAKQALRSFLPTIILVDWNMPDGQGDSHDIISGFRNGADDYVVKPFELEVLYSRILALLRRAGSIKESRLFCDHLSLDKDKMAVYY